MTFRLCLLSMLALVVLPAAAAPERFNIDPDHTFASMPGLIEIGARRVGTNLELSVHDNGPGLAKQGPPSGKGVGLANTRSRLEHLYGASQRLSLEEPEGGGLTVTVMIPFRDVTVAGESAGADDFTEDIKGVA